MRQVRFFFGKGGVGKTTLAASYAAWRASATSKKPILLVSTDPAHNLSDIFEIKLGTSVRQIDPGLCAWQLDATKVMDQWFGERKKDLLDLLDRGSLLTREEWEPMLDLALPGLTEIAGLLVIDDAIDSKRYSEVVVDMAPTGHALRLFDIPRYLETLLDVATLANRREQMIAEQFARRRSAESPVLRDWRQSVERLRSRLRAPESDIVIVSSAEPFSVAEAKRAMQVLVAEGLGQQVRTVVLNRVVSVDNGCERCTRMAEQARRAARSLQKAFPDAELLTGEDAGYPVMGIADLKSYGKHVFAGGAAAKTRNRRRMSPSRLEFKASEWPVPNSHAVLTMGKGGVGKTTVSAALAVCARRQGTPVNICTTDPASSLSDVFDSPVGVAFKSVLGDPELQAVNIDASREFAQWAEEMRSKLNDAGNGSSEGLHVDLGVEKAMWDALLSIAPPGIDEVFGALRVGVWMQQSEMLVVDMAPTGHALELLRTPQRMLAWCRLLLKTLAAHRTLPLAQDASVEIASVEQKVRALASALQDRKLLSAWIVALPEQLPDSETRRLLQSLRKSGIAIGGIIVNRVLADVPERCEHCLRRSHAERAALEKMAGEYSDVPLFAASEMASNIAGRKPLLAFAKRLWRVSLRHQHPERARSAKKAR